jgi:riboflavin kinase/FMN adenylyltransferase
MKFLGIVQRSKGRGKVLGFPTANIEVDKNAEEGVFIGFTSIISSPHEERMPEGQERLNLKSIIFIGAPKTFGETEKKLEVYILDFEGDLYGKEIEVELKKKLRENVKFDSKEKLIEQMKEDETAARTFFNLPSRT